MKTLLWLSCCLFVFWPQQPEARVLPETLFQSGSRHKLELNTNVIRLEYCSSPSDLRVDA